MNKTLARLAATVQLATGAGSALAVITTGVSTSLTGATSALGSST